jgi:hypothetical protein
MRKKKQAVHMVRTACLEERSTPLLLIVPRRQEKKEWIGEKLTVRWVIV